MKYVYRNGGFWLYCDNKQLLDILEDGSDEDKQKVLYVACNWERDEVYTKASPALQSVAHALIATARNKNENLMSTYDKMHLCNYDMKLDAIERGKAVLIGSVRGFHFTDKPFTAFELSVEANTWEWPTCKINDWAIIDLGGSVKYCWSDGYLSFRGQTVYTKVDAIRTMFEDILDTCNTGRD